MAREKTLWKIDPAHSAVEFTVKHMMFSTVRGRFKEFRGSILVDESNPEDSFVEVEIDAASIDTDAQDRDHHLRSADFLHVEEHPKIRFRSTRVEGAHAEDGDHFRVLGDLTIRGRSLEVVLDAVFEGVGKDPWGETRAGFHARGDLDRREWGLMWNQALETGGVLVANKVRLDLTAQAVRVSRSQDEAA